MSDSHHTPPTHQRTASAVTGLRLIGTAALAAFLLAAPATAQRPFHLQAGDAQIPSAQRALAQERAYMERSDARRATTGASRALAQERAYMQQRPVRPAAPPATTTTADHRISAAFLAAFIVSGSLVLGAATLAGIGRHRRRVHA
jgi:hypothetical protein